MYLDILIFAIIAAFLIYRLNAVLGTRPGDEKPRPNPFVSPDLPPPVLQTSISLSPLSQKKTLASADIHQWIDPEANKDGRIETGLDEIFAADSTFNINDFMAGAKYAFEAIVTGYSKGDRASLRPLLSPKLYAGFEAGIKAREDAGHVSTTDIHRVKSSRIIEAHLGGTMAYITIGYAIEQTAVTRDKTGAVIDGNPDSIATIEDIWTFTRDIRSSDPNWILIETRTTEK